MNSPCFNDAIAPHAMYVYSKYPSLILARSGNPLRRRGAPCTSRVAISGSAKRIQMREGGERGNEIRTNVFAGRRLKLQFQGACARHFQSPGGG